jgi:hypothetical protein
MNNIGSIDYVNSDWIDDNDSCIARRCTEFPRIRRDFNSHFEIEKPWGKENPRLFSPFDNPLF